MIADFFKDAPVAGDVHISSTDPKAKGKRKKGKMPVVEDFEVGSKVVKVDDSHGLVFGWAIVCKRDGQDYFDLQADHIPESSMLDAAVDFMQNGALAKEMHEGDPVGHVLFAFPMTTEIAKAFGIETKQTGLLVAMKPSPDVLAKFADGTYTGFSVGGRMLEGEEVE
jgi:hypothetical protein